MSKKKSTIKIDSIHDMGPCRAGGRHVVAKRKGKPDLFTRMNVVESGQPLPQNTDVFYVDKKGCVVDSVRLGTGPARVATEAFRSNWDSVFGESDGDLN